MQTTTAEGFVVTGSQENERKVQKKISKNTKRKQKWEAAQEELESQVNKLQQ